MLEQALVAATSPQIAELDAHLAEWRTEQAAIPAAEGPGTLGYHSQIAPDDQPVKWVQVDLGSSQPMEEVVLVPAHVVYGPHSGPGFGFPPRFKVEVSDSPDFATPRLVADHTSRDFVNPGNRHCHFPTPGLTGRFVRVTATKLWQRTNDFNLCAGRTDGALGWFQSGTRQRSYSPRHDRSSPLLGDDEPGRRSRQPAPRVGRRSGPSLSWTVLEGSIERAVIERRKLALGQLDETSRRV